jgi:hypothetical protein
MASRRSWISEQCKLFPSISFLSLSDLPRTEHANQAKKREGDLNIPALVQSNSALAEPVKIPGMNYMEVNINGKGFERSLLWQLSAWSFTCVSPRSRKMTQLISPQKARHVNGSWLPHGSNQHLRPRGHATPWSYWPRL